MNWGLHAAVRCLMQQNKIIFLVRVAVLPRQLGRPVAPCDPGGLSCRGGGCCGCRGARLCARSRSIPCAACPVPAAQVLRLRSESVTLCTNASGTLWSSYCTTKSYLKNEKNGRKKRYDSFFGSDFAGSPHQIPYVWQMKHSPVNECSEENEVHRKIHTSFSEPVLKTKKQTILCFFPALSKYFFIRTNTFLHF